MKYVLVISSSFLLAAQPAKEEQRNSGASNQTHRRRSNEADGRHGRGTAARRLCLEYEYMFEKKNHLKRNRTQRLRTCFKMYTRSIEIVWI